MEVHRSRGRILRVATEREARLRTGIGGSVTPQIKQLNPETYGMQKGKYTISDQDDAGYWLPREFTNLVYKGLATTLVAPVVKKAETVHVMCDVKDAGQPVLWSYRRAILNIQP